jgi:RNA polymerase sigma-70 factor, ECF subfamily
VIVMALARTFGEENRACYGALVVISPLEEASHAELVARSSGSANRDVETEVCRRFAPRIRLYGLKHLRTEDAARELVQRVLVAVIEALRAGRIDEPQHFERFVLGTCRNLASRWRAAEQRAQVTDPLKLDGLDVRAVCTPVEAIDAAKLMQCLGKLEERARTVVHLSFYRERSADEIGDALGMTAGNVRVVRHRAMVALRDCMERAA